jgi:hypothetical protein
MSWLDVTNLTESEKSFTSTNLPVGVCIVNSTPNALPSPLVFGKLPGLREKLAV